MDEEPIAEKDAANPYAGTPLEGWAAALVASDEAMDATLAACGTPPGGGRDDA